MGMDKAVVVQATYYFWRIPRDNGKPRRLKFLYPVRDRNGKVLHFLQKGGKGAQVGKVFSVLEIRPCLERKVLVELRPSVSVPDGKMLFLDSGGKIFVAGEATGLKDPLREDVSANIVDRLCRS